MDNQAIGALVNKYALKYNLRPDIVACVIIQESNGNPFAIRYEPTFYKNYLDGKLPSSLSGFVPTGSPSYATELFLRACSFSLMQVMGDTARWLFKFRNPYLTALLDPDVGVDCGCAVLRFYLDRESVENYTHALSRYNSGSPNSQAGMAYAARVFERVKNKEYERFLGGNN